ncbi:MAG TPA: tRNA glutamyl-Q(34) synthetase GluQRS [Propionibacteriaceae bacterium]
MAGRFAPSPTSELHVGNLRTALLAWLFARTSGRDFLVRIEDLDQARVAAAAGVAERQLADLAALGIDHDGEVVRQSERLPLYAAALERLEVYECYCSRREIAESAQAPHGVSQRPYPGTCRDLTEAERAAKRAVRPAALRVRAGGATWTVTDELYGLVTREVDDFVLRRGDGTYAYNLAVVVDDGAQGIDQVVRGDDLLSSAPRQAWLADQLGITPPTYAHVPLAVSPDGLRLAKRDGAVTMTDLAALGVTPDAVLTRLASSLGLASAREKVTPADLLDRFDPAALPHDPWVVE